MFGECVCGRACTCAGGRGGGGAGVGGGCAHPFCSVAKCAYYVVATCPLNLSMRTGALHAWPGQASTSSVSYFWLRLKASESDQGF